MQDWNEIVREYASLVQNAALRVLGNETDAEDVTQEVFAEAFSKWEANSNQQWAGLLRKISVCRAIDVLRARKNEEALSPLMADVSISAPEAEAVARELQIRLRSATADLPQRESQVFCLFHFENLTLSETADLLGISNMAVRAALSKARSKLEKIFLTSNIGNKK